MLFENLPNKATVLWWFAAKWNEMKSCVSLFQISSNWNQTDNSISENFYFVPCCFSLYLLLFHICCYWFRLCLLLCVYVFVCAFFFFIQLHWPLITVGKTFAGEIANGIMVEKDSDKMKKKKKWKANRLLYSLAI